MDKKVMARLRKLSKEDLLWVIEQMCARSLDNCLYYLSCALSDLEYNREIQRIDEADKYAKLSTKKRLEYIDLMAPYAGKPFGEIPLDVLSKGARLIKEAQAADKKYLQLSGFNIKED